MTVRLVVRAEHLRDLRWGNSARATSASGDAYRLYRMGAKIQEIEGVTTISVPADVLDDLTFTGIADWTPFDQATRYIIKIEP